MGASMSVGFRCALLLAAVGVGCTSDPWTPGALVSFVVKDEAARPDYILATWFRGDAVVIPSTRVEVRGTFKRAEDFRASAFFLLDEHYAEERKILAKGMRAAGQVSIGAARIQVAGQSRVDVTVVLKESLADSDQDGLPDAIDEDCRGAAPAACPGAVDAGTDGPNVVAAAVDVPAGDVTGGDGAGEPIGFACGAAGQACCPANACKAGHVCFGVFPTCVPCGRLWQPCCGMQRTCMVGTCQATMAGLRCQPTADAGSSETGGN